MMVEKKKKVVTKPAGKKVPKKAATKAPAKKKAAKSTAVKKKVVKSQPSKKKIAPKKASSKRLSSAKSERLLTAEGWKRMRLKQIEESAKKLSKK